MADNTAHVPAGPEAEATDVDGSTTVSSEDTPSMATDVTDQETGAMTDADPAEAAAPDVELVGWASTAVARLGEADAPPVLVGAASAARGDELTSTQASGPAPAGGAGASPSGLDDLPVWSYRDAPLGHREPAPPAPDDRHQTELPFARAAEPAPPPPRPLPTFGPVGQPRSALLVPLFAVISLGVYAIVWHHRVNRELEEFDPKLHSRPARSALAVSVPWLIGLLVTLAGAALIVAGRMSIHLPLASHVTSLQSYLMLAGLAVVPYLTLVIPISLVAIVMTLERLRCVEEHVGTTTDRQVRPVGSALLLVLPVVGGLVLLATEQRRLNAIWDAVAPAGRLAR
jgi:hypothetical protein